METNCTFTDKCVDTSLHDFSSLSRLKKMVPYRSGPTGGTIDTIYVLFEPLPKNWHICIHRLYIIALQAEIIRVIWLVCYEEVQ